MKQVSEDEATHRIRYHPEYGWLIEEKITEDFWKYVSGSLSPFRWIARLKLKKILKNPPKNHTEYYKGP